MRIRKFSAVTALAAFVAISPVALAKNGKGNGDRKGDQHRTHPQSQKQSDRRDLAQRNSTSEVASRLQQMDADRDGRVSRFEWTGDPVRFDQLDRDRDGYLTEYDFGRYGEDPWRASDDGNRFRGMDRNGDGRITRAEWRGNDNSFRNHDRNGDGVISGAEIESGKGGRRR